MSFGCHQHREKIGEGKKAYFGETEVVFMEETIGSRSGRKGTSPDRQEAA